MFKRDSSNPMNFLRNFFKLFIILTCILSELLNLKFLLKTTILYINSAVDATKGENV